MKKWIAYSLVLVLICALFSACGNSELKITLTNKLDYDIVQLYIGEADDEDEGEFVFDDDILEDNDSIEVSVEPTDSKSYSILAMDTSGDYYYFNDLPLSNGAVVKLVATKDGYEAVVTPKNGDRVTVEGELILGETGDAEEAAAVEEVVAAPTPDDPLDASIPLPGYESLVIPYPSTMKVALSNERFLQIDAINDPDNHEVIMVDLIEIQGSYDDRLSSSDTAQAAFAEIAPKICDIQFPGMLISTVGTEFIDGGTYYSAVNYLWMSGEVFEQPANTPVRGVLECRYYGHTGYILAVFTLADEGAIQNYFGIASNIINAISFGDGWTTPDASGSGGWSDPGDYGYYEDGQWYESNDYDPWSDPGDGNDEWSDPGDTYDDGYDAWSDPGDGDDEWSDPGDTYDDGYDVWSDPGDGDDEWSDPGDTYDDGYDVWSDPGDGDDEWSDAGDDGYDY